MSKNKWTPVAAIHNHTNLFRHNEAESGEVTPDEQVRALERFVRYHRRQAQLGNTLIDRVRGYYAKGGLVERLREHLRLITESANTDPFVIVGRCQMIEDLQDAVGALDDTKDKDREALCAELFKELCACAILPPDSPTRLTIAREDVSKAVRTVFGDETFQRAIRR